jgi:hypothetical protein
LHLFFLFSFVYFFEGFFFPPALPDFTSADAAQSRWCIVRGKNLRRRLSRAWMTIHRRADKGGQPLSHEENNPPTLHDATIHQRHEHFGL